MKYAKCCRRGYLSISISMNGISLLHQNSGAFFPHGATGILKYNSYCTMPRGMVQAGARAPAPASVQHSGRAAAHRLRERRCPIMMDLEELERMEKESRGLLESGRLEDLSGVTVSGDTPMQRLESLAAQLKNLYCFRVGNTPVRISFNENGPTLEESLTRYFKSLKQGERL